MRAPGPAVLVHVNLPASAFIVADRRGLGALDFWHRLSQEVLTNSYEVVPNNIDQWRFGGNTTARAVKEKVLRLAASLGFVKAPWNYRAKMEEVLSFAGLEGAMDFLGDDVSRDLLVRLMAYRILGPRHYRLPMNTAAYWEARAAISPYRRATGVVKNVPYFGSLDEFELDGLHLIAHALIVLNTFVVEQYRCRRANIGVRPGDVVVDGGACWGDTSLYFAREAERVFAYECMPFNQAIFRRNMELNRKLAEKIELVDAALWRSSGETLVFSVDGSASRANSTTGLPVKTHTIDDLVAEKHLGRVDFIKMDIEGAEFNALAGAERTIRQFKPRLAICVYHSLEDFVRIPKWIAGLGLGYRLYLDHFTIYQEESIVFAEAGEGYERNR